MSVRSVVDMGQHPDVVALRARHDRAAETAPAQTAEGLILLGGLYLAVSPWGVSGDVATTSTIWSNGVTGAVAVAFGLAATSFGVLSRD